MAKRSEVGSGEVTGAERAARNDERNEGRRGLGAQPTDNFGFFEVKFEHLQFILMVLLTFEKNH